MTISEIIWRRRQLEDFWLASVRHRPSWGKPARERWRALWERRVVQYKVEIGSQDGTSAELADISHITSGAFSPGGDAVLSTDTPAALPYWPRLSHMPACEWSTEGGSVTWSNGTSREHSSPLQSQFSLLALLSQTNPSVVYKAALVQNRDCRIKRLDVYLSRQKARKKAINRWGLCGFYVEAGCRWLSLSGFFWCACITKVLALSHKLSRHPHH